MKETHRSWGIVLLCACSLFAALVLVLLAEVHAADKPARKEEPNVKADCPNLSIANGPVKLTLYTPDLEKGYYRGSRFEASGVVARAEFGGHVFFGPWRPFDPKGHDNIMGTAEEFCMFRPCGFDEVDAGGTFYKIGVGGLVKQEKPRKDEKTGKTMPAEYGFWFGHKFSKPATWQVTSGPDRVRFEQAFTGERGWGWRLVKRVALAKDAPRFTISRELTNTGTKTIDTTHYCHHFTIIDGEPIGPAYSVTLGFEARAKEIKGERAKVQGRQIVLTAPLGDQTVWLDLAGFGTTAADHAVTVENRKTGAALEITGDTPLKLLRFWAADKAACPEPFVAIHLAPGESMKWSNTYTLRVGKAK